MDSVDRNGLKSKSGEMTRHFFYGQILGYCIALIAATNWASVAIVVSAKVKV